MINKELIGQIITALENDENLSSTLVSIILKDEKSRTIIQTMIAEESTKQINERFGKPEIDKNKKIICPDCGRLLTWTSYHKRFQHDGNNPDCFYEINAYGDCIWNNKMREEYINKQNNID